VVTTVGESSSEGSTDLHDGFPSFSNLGFFLISGCSSWFSSSWIFGLWGLSLSFSLVCFLTNMTSSLDARNFSPFWALWFLYGFRASLLVVSFFLFGTRLLFSRPYHRVSCSWLFSWWCLPGFWFMVFLASSWLLLTETLWTNWLLVWDFCFGLLCSGSTRCCFLVCLWYWMVLFPRLRFSCICPWFLFFAGSTPQHNLGWVFFLCCFSRRFGHFKISVFFFHQHNLVLFLDAGIGSILAAVCFFSFFFGYPLVVQHTS